MPHGMYTMPKKFSTIGEGYTLVAKPGFGKVVWEADCCTTGVTKAINVKQGRASAEVELL